MFSAFDVSGLYCYTACFMTHDLELFTDCDTGRISKLWLAVSWLGGLTLFWQGDQVIIQFLVRNSRLNFRR